MAKMQVPINQIWLVYNHMPAGNLVAIHFEDIVRKRRGREGEEEIFISAKEQAENFKKSPQVALYVNKKLVKNEALVYDGPSLFANKRAANVALEWARGRGAEPYVTGKGKEPLPHEHTKRIETLESRVNSMDGKIDRVLEALEAKK